MLNLLLGRTSKKSAMEGSSEDAMDVSGAEGVTSQGNNMERKHQNDEMLAAGLGADQLDIYILCDTTGSMGDYVSSLAATIIQVRRHLCCDIG